MGRLRLRHDPRRRHDGHDDRRLRGARRAGARTPHWISYVSVEDVDAAARAAAANGGRVIEAPHDLPGVGRTARIADPQGAELCLFKNAEGDPADPPATEPPPARASSGASCTPATPARALSFYEKVLGFTHRRWTWARPGPTTSCPGTASAAAASRASCRAARLRTGSPTSRSRIPTRRSRGRGSGAAKVHFGPEDIPGIGRFAVLEDPTGAVLAVMKAVPRSAKEA